MKPSYLWSFVGSMLCYLTKIKFELFYNITFLMLPTSLDVKKQSSRGVLRNSTKLTGKHLCQSYFFNKVPGLRSQACNFIKKETLEQVFSCGFCEIFLKSFLQNTNVAASGFLMAECLVEDKQYLWKGVCKDYKSPLK